MGPPIPLGAPNSRLRAAGRALRWWIDEGSPTPDFTILSETEDWIALDKPAHLLVHPSLPTHRETLWDGLKCLLSYELVNGGQISIITRLDRETSGVVLVAKHSRAARQLGLTMQRGHFSKTYLAVVFGWPVEDAFTIDGPLRRAGEVEESAVWVRQRVHPDGRPSRTDFRVLQRWSHGGDGGLPLALMECTPRTGRMHQIRVHLSHAGHGIVGDKLYGRDSRHYLDFIEQGWTPSMERELILNRQALHAHRLSWEGGDCLSPLPRDMAGLIG